jgi:lysophospholipid acyltransferase (LPLAT)-like uncharacterized protein
MLKQIIGNPVVQFLIGRTIGLYMLLVGWTTRWTLVNRAAVEPFWRGDGKLVACIWHGRFTLVHKLWTFGRGATKAVFLISRSREGGIVAHASRTVGANVIRGSAAKGDQQKGGVEAVRELVRHIEGGGCIGMTPDGPRGPRMRARHGPVQLARLAGAPLMALAWSTNRRIVFDSWDSFILPLPFGRGALIWSDPIEPPAQDASLAEIDEVRLKLEAELNRISAEADRIAGVDVIEPAPARNGALDAAEAAVAK